MTFGGYWNASRIAKYAALDSRRTLRVFILLHLCRKALRNLLLARTRRRAGTESKSPLSSYLRRHYNVNCYGSGPREGSRGKVSFFLVGKCSKIESIRNRTRDCFKRSIYLYRFSIFLPTTFIICINKYNNTINDNSFAFYGIWKKKYYLHNNHNNPFTPNISTWSKSPLHSTI